MADCGPVHELRVSHKERNYSLPDLPGGIFRFGDGQADDRGDFEKVYDLLQWEYPGRHILHLACSDITTLCGPGGFGVCGMSME